MKKVNCDFRFIDSYNGDIVIKNLTILHKFRENSVDLPLWMGKQTTMCTNLTNLNK